MAPGLDGLVTIGNSLNPHPHLMYGIGGKSGGDLKLGRETLSLAFPSSGMRQAFRWRPAFTKALTASVTI